jgi:hypothetical protein
MLCAKLFLIDFYGGNVPNHVACFAEAGNIFLFHYIVCNCMLKYLIANYEHKGG